MIPDRPGFVRAGSKDAISDKETAVRDLTVEEIKLVSGAGKDGPDPDENSKNGENDRSENNNTHRHRKEDRELTRDNELLPIG
jgi:hypothetical protein